MKYISVFSGIEAASAAWKSLGFDAVAFSEIDPFANAVLQNHYPNTLNLGDISKVDWRAFHGKAEILVGGSPCQSFSVAGNRTGLEGSSGLVREYFRVLEEMQPTWFVWENVPGAMSSHGGKDFEFLLQRWNDIGYHVSWRILDAQFFGVPQRRRRVFVVGHIRDWKRPVEVLFEPEVMRRDIGKSGKKGERLAESVADCVGRGDSETTTFVIQGNGVRPSVNSGCNGKGWSDDGVSYTLTATDRHSVLAPRLFGLVRRLTPLECERLQGFPDNYTRVPWRGRSAEYCADAPRYRVLGNSMAVPVMKWLGERILLASKKG